MNKVRVEDYLKPLKNIDSIKFYKEILNLMIDAENTINGKLDKSFVEKKYPKFGKAIMRYLMFEDYFEDNGHSVVFDKDMLPAYKAVYEEKISRNRWKNIHMLVTLIISFAALVVSIIAICKS